MIYKNVSVKRVIAKVFADMDLQEGSHKISDMIEWAADAVERIGAFSSFVTKVAGMDGNPPLELKDYQTQLPPDFHRLIQIEYSPSPTGPFYPMRYATGSYAGFNEITKSDSKVSSNVVAESDLVKLAMDLYQLDYEAALRLINEDPHVREQLTGILASTTIGGVSSPDMAINSTNDYTYVVVGNYIKTNTKDGYLLVSYQAVPTDDEGYPLIPDDASYMEAVYWYIVMKLTYPEWRAGRVRDAVYYDARRSWNYYAKQAYANAMMPTRDQMESIKNTWLRLVHEIHEHSSAYSTVGQQQIVYNQD